MRQLEWGALKRWAFLPIERREGVIGTFKQDVANLRRDGHGQLADDLGKAIEVLQVVGESDGRVPE